jgi:hypothetical protein
VILRRGMAAPTIYCVLRSGGEYVPWHVAWLHSQVARWLPDIPFKCLSDVPVTCERVPLRYGWPGWWAKMELFRPDLLGDVLYFDLDTIIVGDIAPLVNISRTTLLRDVYAPQHLGSGLMYLTETDRGRVWERWSGDPEGWLRTHASAGDQNMIELALGDCQRWQDILPGACLHYKVDVRDAGAPLAECRVVVFQGKPRPWHVAEPWIIPSCSMSATREAQVEAITAKIAHLQAECAGLRTSLRAVYDSRSWRMTTPLRSLGQWARGLVQM